MRPQSYQVLGDLFVIVWDDGHESYYPLEALRRACPCAACSGEPDLFGRMYGGGPQRYRPESFILQSVEPIGNYALQPNWADGHTYGICDWTALRLDKQLKAKRRILSESLRRIGKFDVATLPDIRVHPSPLNYRLRSRLHRDGDAVGFYAMRSNRVVPLARECEVVGVETARHAVEGETWEVDHDLIADERELTLTVEAYTYRLHTRAFFQVNRHLLATLLRLVRAHAAAVRNRGSAIDLYGGVGFFTLPIAELFERVTMVEGSRLSAHYARMNVPSHVEVIDAPVEARIARLPPADFVFLDPPRAGARREVITTVAEQTRERITYLSCDPVTFARDANLIVAKGWRVVALDLVDLFPNTHHVETLAAFEK